jgi:hypothetical protein
MVMSATGIVRIVRSSINIQDGLCVKNYDVKSSTYHSLAGRGSLSLILCGGGQNMKSTGLRKVICLALLPLFSAIDCAAAQEVFLDLKRVADKARPEIEKILGMPSQLVDDVFRSTRGYIYPAVRATYMNGAIEVTYLEGGARYFKIWIAKLGGKYAGYSYPEDIPKLLEDFGLDRNTTPDSSNPTVTRWRDLPDLYEINVFATAEKQIWYVHVMTSRIYQ